MVCTRVKPRGLVPSRRKLRVPSSCVRCVVYAVSSHTNTEVDIDIDGRRSLRQKRKCCLEKMNYANPSHDLHEGSAPEGRRRTSNCFCVRILRACRIHVYRTRQDYPFGTIPRYTGYVTEHLTLEAKVGRATGCKLDLVLLIKCKIQDLLSTTTHAQNTAFCR